MINYFYNLLSTIMPSSWASFLSSLSVAIIVFFISWFVLKIFKLIILARLKKIATKTKNNYDDYIIKALEVINWPFYFLVSVYIAIHFADLPAVVEKISYFLFLTVIVYYVIKILEKIIDRSIDIIIKKKAEENKDIGILKFTGGVLKVFLWISAIVLLLSNMGYNVTSLIAGLGIGGIAVALALQNILGDLFSSLTIYFDKPFKVGDFVAVGDQFGTVTKVGVKTTRIQVPQGEELVVSNSELTSSKIRNFGVMEKRRVAFDLGVSYETSYENLKNIPNIINKIITKQKGANFDRVHFKSFGDFSLIFEIVYYVNSGDYVEYMDVQQNINLSIFEQFATAGIEIAFPTQTVYLKK